MLSWINNFAGRFQSVINYERKAINVFKQINANEEIEYDYLGIAWAYKWLREFDSAIYYTEIAMSYADSSSFHSIYNTFGSIYSQQFRESGDTSLLDRAIEWYIKGLNSPEIDDHLKAGIHNNLFHAYYKYGKKEMDSLALYHLKQTIPSAVKTKDAFYTIPGNWMWRGKLLQRDGKYDSAIILYNRCLDIVDSALSNFSMSGYSLSYYGLQNRYFLKTRRSDAYYWLYDVYTTIGDHKKALEYYINYKNAREEIYQESTKNLVAMLEAESENEKTEKKIAMLEQDNRFNQLKVAQSRNFIIGMGILLVVLILMGVLFIRQNKLKNEHKSTLLEQKLLRLQMNPHFIFNALSNIMHAIEENENKNALSYLHKFSKLLRTTLESSREDYILLEDEITSTEHYLELQKLRYEEKFEFSIETDEKIDLENAVIPPMLIQPFIENAIEHGIRHKVDKGHIIVRFNLKDQKIVCEIEDDGVGREKAWEAEYKHKEHKSLATSIILDRIQAINKKMKEKIRLEIIDLKSDLNEPLGTKVVIDIPLV